MTSGWTTRCNRSIGSCDRLKPCGLLRVSGRLEAGQDAIHQAVAQDDGFAVQVADALRDNQLRLASICRTLAIAEIRNAELRFFGAKMADRELSEVPTSSQNCHRGLRRSRRPARRPPGPGTDRSEGPGIPKISEPGAACSLHAGDRRPRIHFSFRL